MLPIHPAIVPQPNLLELARQGNVQVLSALMNRLLKPQGMMADVSRQEARLEILIESDLLSPDDDPRVPNQEVLVAMVRKWFTKLGVRTISRVSVSWQQAGQEVPAWTQEFPLGPPSAASIASTFGMDEGEAEAPLDLEAEDRAAQMAEMASGLGGADAHPSAELSTNDAFAEFTPDEFAVDEIEGVARWGLFATSTPSLKRQMLEFAACSLVVTLAIVLLHRMLGKTAPPSPRQAQPAAAVTHACTALAGNGRWA